MTAGIPVRSAGAAALGGLHRLLLRADGPHDVPEALLAVSGPLGRVGWSLMLLDEPGGRRLLPDASAGLPPEWSPEPGPLPESRWPAFRAAAEGAVLFGSGLRRPFPLPAASGPAAWAALPAGGGVLVCLRPGPHRWNGREQRFLARAAALVGTCGRRAARTRHLGPSRSRGPVAAPGSAPVPRSAPVSRSWPVPRSWRAPEGSDPLRLRAVECGEFTLDLATGTVRCDDGFARLHGLDGLDRRARVPLGLLLRLLPPGEERRMSLALDRVRRRPGSWELVYRVRREGGPGHLRAEASCVAGADGSPGVVRGRVTDVTAEFEAAGRQAARLRQQLRCQEHILALAAEAASAAGTEELAAAACRSLQLLGADAIVLAEDDGGSLQVITSVGHTAEDMAATAGLPLESRLPLCDALRLRLPVFVPSRQDLAERYPHLTAVLPGLRRRSWAALPLPVPAASRAAACLLSFERPHAFGPQDEPLLVATAELLGIALDRCRAYDTARARAVDLLGLFPPDPGPGRSPAP
ncbi:GAF domain-containing protein [Streptacidiphilus sp. ASG 303]|uniref:GAF domain-containing protein n=1 Tax=Streptacidiphilus sp. ASG 303 TaxID=2896847 RepID=UPI001E49BEE4|nr:GAF domain-containing protein [Streptacidiphilus sp. ASG 303]MCD0481093.1 GAF domain-containing protein [Streptacidiphilus sp. ASG 303]